MIGTDHEGHASGPQAEQFGNVVKQFIDWMNDDQALARLYNALLARPQSNSFNPTSLNATTHSNPIMQQLQAAAGNATVEVLEEYLNATNRKAIPQAELLRDVDLKLRDSQLRHLMSALDWRLEKAKWGGVDYARAVWVHPEYQIHRGKVVGPNSFEADIGEKEFSINKEPEERNEDTDEGSLY